MSQAPRSSSPIDVELTRELRALLVGRLVAESPFSEATHVVLIFIVAASLWPFAPHGEIARWVTAVSVAAIGRGLLRRHAQRSGSNPAHTLRVFRLGVLASGIAWGFGVLLVGVELPLVNLAWVTVVFAGIVAGATVTLLPDATSFYILCGTMLTPLAVAIARNGDGSSSAFGVFVTILFGVAMAAFFRRSHRALVEQFVIAKRVELTERAAGNERAMLDALVEGAPSAIAVVSDDGRVLRINRSFESTFGFSAAEAIGVPLNDLVVSEDDMAGAHDLDRRVRSGEKVIAELRRRRRDGSMIHVRIAAAPVTTLDGRVTFIIYDDATEAQRARVAERQLVRIVEATTDHVGIASPDGKLRYMNPAGRAMIGIPPDEDIAKLSLLDIIPPRLHEQVLQQFQEVIREGSWKGEIAFLHRNGGEVPVSLVALAHRNAAGEIDATAAVARDISAEVAARDALRTARDSAEQATKAKSAFLANTSHEIRTPLNGILGMVELLLDTELTPAQRRSAELIANSGETLLDTINDLLDLSKIEASQLELEAIPFDLHHVIHSAVRLFMPRAHQQNNELVSDIGSDVPQHVRGDPHRLRQVLSNLVGNAVKFTKRGDVVVQATLAKSANGTATVRIGVRDSGIGIAREHIDRIFEPFRQVDASTTRQYGGTGLGLSIARRLVEMMGGNLVVDSVVGKGSEFHFTVRFPVETAAAPVEDRQGGLADVAVLVVDDHPTNRRVLCAMLQWAGCVVDTAVDAADALKALREAARNHTPYRLVVSDVQMPGRDGFQLAGDIRADAALPNVRVMLLTSAGQRGDGQRCREFGVAAYMQKPVSRVELVEAAVAALREATNRAPRPSLVTRHTIDETRRRLRILLAEDNSVNQEVAAAMLRKRGHDVEVVGDGQAAVDAVRRGPRFDVVLMDLQMPKLDGLLATRAIRNHGDSITPIVALTANILPGEKDRCLAGGMNGYVSKPFKAHELFAAVEGWSGDDAPASESPTVPHIAPVDLEGFRAVLADAGIESTGDQMLRVFLDFSASKMSALQQAAAARNASVAESIAHTLKSAAGTVHALKLADLFRETELAAQAADTDRVIALAREITTEHARVVAFLDEHLDSPYR